MVWVDSSPSIQVPISIEEHDVVLKMVHVPHTPLLVLLTETSVLVYDQHTLLPLACHKRSEHSLNSHGYNTNVKVKQISVNSSQLTKISTLNLFVQSDSGYLIIYQAFINYSKSLYEVYNGKNDELLQTSLPLSDTTNKFSFKNLLKTATQTIVSGNQGQFVNLENIEHFNNSSVEDDCCHGIQYVKLSIFKILKISIGIDDFWLKANSHNLVIFNQTNNLQIINISNFKNEVWSLGDLAWFDKDWTVKCFNYNELNNHFMFINHLNEVWLGTIKSNNEHEQDIEGHLVSVIDGEPQTTKIIFNPLFPLVSIQIDSKIELFKLESVSDQLQLPFIKTLYHSDTTSANFKVDWSPCGEFLTIIDNESGHWKIVSKFGSTLFASRSILDELTDINDRSTDFLKASNLKISPNAHHLYIINKPQTQLYLVRLSRPAGINSSNVLLYNNEYITIPSVDNILNRLPLLPRFKKIINNLQYTNGSSSNKALKNLSGVWNMSYNDFHQISISYGSHISISTPITDGSKTNHVLWFNFQDYFMETLNVVNHFWYDDYLVLINRYVKDDEVLVDELIVLDTTLSKYGHGGSTSFSFDSDLIIWRHTFDNEILTFELSDSPDVNVKNLVIIGSDMKIIIVELSKDKFDKKTNKKFRIFIGINKTIHLSSIKHKLPLHLVRQTSMIDGKHFLFLLSNGDFYLLRNQTRTAHTPRVNGDANGSKNHSMSTLQNPIDLLKPNSNMYDLIKLNKSIEYFQIKTLAKLSTTISLFNGQCLLIYDLSAMIESAFDNSDYSQQNDDLDGFDKSTLSTKKNVIDPVTITVYNNNYPLTIIDSFSNDDTSESLRSIDLIGFEITPLLKNDVFIFKQGTTNQLILNNFIEYDLYVANLAHSVIIAKYSTFENFRYCLELILFRQLTRSDEADVESELDDEGANDLSKIVTLIKEVANFESIFVNCLRKIEVGYWHAFFDTLQSTPVEFMNRLIGLDDVELCYNFLIVYLNFKKEFDVDSSSPRGQDSGESTPSPGLDHDDEKIILKIIRMLDASGKWDSCFELCRFIKLLEPTNKLLNLIRQALNSQ